QSVSIVWTVDRDATRIRSTHRARVGLTPAWKHVHEGLVSIAVFEEFLEVRSLGDSGIECGVNAANHWYQVRHKRQANVPAFRLAQSLQDLRPVTMARDSVCLEVVCRLGEKQMFLGLLAGTAHPGLCVGDQVPRIDRASRKQRNQAKLDRGRVAPGIRDQ